MFVRNAWYIAAWSDEVAKSPLARRILGEPVVLFRDASGTVAGCRIDAVIAAHRSRAARWSSAESSADITVWFSIPQGSACWSPAIIRYRRERRSARIRGRTRRLGMGLDGRSGKGRPRANHPLSLPQRLAQLAHQHTMMHLRSDYLLVLDNLMDLSHLAMSTRATSAATPTLTSKRKCAPWRTPME